MKDNIILIRIRMSGL